MNFAIIKTGGKQYKVRAGDKIKIERLTVKEGGEVVFDKVLLKSDGKKVSIGKPYLAKETVHGTVLKLGRSAKKIVFKYKPKKRYRKKKGHRQHYTEVEIVKI